VWRLQWLLQNVPRKAHQHFDLDLLVATVLCAAIVAAGVTLAICRHHRGCDLTHCLTECCGRLS
jgi:hypothetical protein